MPNRKSWILTALIITVVVTAVGLLIAMADQQQCPHRECPNCGSPWIFCTEAIGPNPGKQSVECTDCGWKWK